MNGRLTRSRKMQRLTRLRTERHDGCQCPLQGQRRQGQCDYKLPEK